MQILKTINKPRWLQHIDWNLFVFLILFLNVKMPVKIAALIFSLLLNKKLFFEKFRRLGERWRFCGRDGSLRSWSGGGCWSRCRRLRRRRGRAGSLSGRDPLPR